MADAVHERCAIGHRTPEHSAIQSIANEVPRSCSSVPPPHSRIGTEVGGCACFTAHGPFRCVRAANHPRRQSCQPQLLRGRDGGGAPARAQTRRGRLVHVRSHAFHAYRAATRIRQPAHPPSTQVIPSKGIVQEISVDRRCVATPGRRPYRILRSPTFSPLVSKLQQDRRLRRPAPRGQAAWTRAPGIPQQEFDSDLPPV